MKRVLVAVPFAALIALALLRAPTADPPRAASELPVVATFSIVARDPDTGDLGIAVQSKFFGVGSVVPWAKAGVGAIATQSYANTTYGPKGLELLAKGDSPEDVMKALTGADDEAAKRQAGIVDAKGRSSSFTGKECMAFAGGRQGENYAVQGNILAGEEVVTAMEASWKSSKGELGDRLVEALAAAQSKGGDKRGMQSASLLVVRDKGGYAGFNDRWIDIRVEDHAKPIEELKRLLEMHKKFFPRK
ncbi:MAG: hypothetical protein FD180_2963 [Planctomycetota bacterium]|nr:MAG: hypothetical protein FD180_2963 [Planctomycetota bacterium]